MMRAALGAATIAALALLLGLLRFTTNWKTAAPQAGRDGFGNFAL
jgi:hypothetical protein